MKPDEPDLDPALPTTVTPSGRVVYDPLQAARIEVDVPAAGNVSHILRELRALDDGDARDAVPAPVPLLPSSDGALVTKEGQDAAKAHVEAVVPAMSPAGQIDSAPVKITDLRRLPTARIEKKSPWIVAAEPAEVAEAAEPESDPAALPSATAPSSRPPPVNLVAPIAAEDGDRGRASARSGAGGASSSKGRGVLALAGVAATALVVFLVLRGSPELPHSGATGSTSFAATESATAPASTTGADIAGTATEPTIAGPATAATDTGASAMVTTSAAVSGQAIAPGVAPTTATATATKSTAPRTSGDPYADAGASPKPTASAEPTVAPVVSSAPSVAPVATTAPSVKPSATTTNPWDAPFEKQKKKDSESQ